MSLIPREYAYLVIIIALGGSLWWFAVHEQHKGAEKCLADQEVQAAADKAQGEKAVAEARTRAAEDESKQAKKQAENSQREADHIKQQAADAHAKYLNTQMRYEKALVESRSCAEWSKQVIPCPLE